MKNSKKLLVLFLTVLSFNTIFALPIIGLVNLKTDNCDKYSNWYSVRKFSLSKDIYARNKAILFDVNAKNLVITIPNIYKKMSPQLFVNGKMQVKNEITLDKEISTEILQRLKFNKPRLLNIKIGNYIYKELKNQIIIKIPIKQLYLKKHLTSIGKN